MQNKYQSRIEVIKAKPTFSNHIKKLMGLKYQTNTFEYKDARKAKELADKTNSKLKITITKK